MFFLALQLAEYCLPWKIMATFLVASNWAHPNHGTSHVGPGRLVPWVHAPASLAKTNGTMGTACVTLLGMVAVTKRSRARVLRRAQRPINARDGKTIPQGALLGRWLFGGCWDCFLLKTNRNPPPPPQKKHRYTVHKVHELFPHEDFFKQKTSCYYRSITNFQFSPFPFAPGGSWLFPAIDDDELYEEMENELPPKKSLEDSVYCCWVTWLKDVDVDFLHLVRIGWNHDLCWSILLTTYPVSPRKSQS